MNPGAILTPLTQQRGPVHNLNMAWLLNLDSTGRGLI
jgi:hypothetical protein